MKIYKHLKSVIHLPHLLKNSKEYERILTVDNSLFAVSDKCQPGWSKIWGIALFYHHINSYRFVFRITDSQLIIGYYAYINHTSPQQNNKLKGAFKLNQILPGDHIKMKLKKGDHYITLSVEHFNKDFSLKSIDLKTLPLPAFRRWPVWLLYPNIKCRATQTINFKLFNSNL